MKTEIEEVHEQFTRIEAAPAPHGLFLVGNLVRWRYESPDDPQFGTVYIVVGYNKETPMIVVTRKLTDLYSIREFHASQLVLA